jgi:hypothetical protein
MINKLGLPSRAYPGLFFGMEVQNKPAARPYNAPRARGKIKWI